MYSSLVEIFDDTVEKDPEVRKKTKKNESEVIQAKVSLWCKAEVWTAKFCSGGTS